MNSQTYQQLRRQVLESIDRLRSINDDLRTHHSLFVGELPSDVKQRIMSLDREASRLRNPDLTIAFVGGFSAGKSSLVNAFLGRYLLPESTKVTTAVPTFVRAADESECAELHYLGRAEFDTLGDLYREELAGIFGRPDFRTIPYNEIVNEADTLSVTGRGQRVLQQFKEYYEQRNEAKIEERPRYRTVSIEEAQACIRDEKHAMLLDRVVLKIANSELPSDVVLVDLPGVSVPNPRHREITFRFVREEAHAVVFVLMATRLFDKDEMEVMELFRSGDARVSDKTFWVLNRWDSLSTQQQRQTIVDFENKMKDFGLSSTAKCFRTNALHGLLAQLRLTVKSPVDPAIQTHLDDYDVVANQNYGGDHEIALRESQIPQLQTEVFRFLNNDIRRTTLRSAIENCRMNFLEPIPYHLRSAKEKDEAALVGELTSRQKEEVQKLVDERYESRVAAIRRAIRELCREVSVKRSEILRERTEELVHELQSKITKGPETDAYQVYQQIIAERELRKYPFHFEIEVHIVDSLNALLKRNFREIVRFQVKAVFEDLASKVQDALVYVQQDVDYSADVMQVFDQIIREESSTFGVRVDGHVMTQVSELDALLLYRPKALFGAGNEILDGLEQAARMGLENLSKPGKAIAEKDFAAKTAKIRETLSKHYIEKVREYHQDLTGNLFPIVINNMQQIESRIITAMQTKYRNALEASVAVQVESNFADERKAKEQRSRRFRGMIEEIESIGAELNALVDLEQVASKTG